MNYTTMPITIVVLISLGLCIPSIAAMETNTDSTDVQFQEYADTMLIKAVKNEYYRAAQELLAYHKANPDTKYKDTPVLCKAAKHRDGHITKLLLVAGANQNASDSTGSTALHYATCMDSLKSLEALLQHPYIDPNIGDISGSTALHYAACMGIPNCLQALLHHKDINPNSIDTDGNTPLVCLVQAVQEIIGCKKKLAAGLGECFKLLWHDERVNRTDVERMFAKNPALRKALFTLLITHRRK